MIHIIQILIISFIPLSGMGERIFHSCKKASIFDISLLKILGTQIPVLKRVRTRADRLSQIIECVRTRADRLSQTVEGVRTRADRLSQIVEGVRSRAEKLSQIVEGVRSRGITGKPF